MFFRCDPLLPSRHLMEAASQGCLSLKALSLSRFPSLSLTRPFFPLKVLPLSLSLSLKLIQAFLSLKALSLKVLSLSLKALSLSRFSFSQSFSSPSLSLSLSKRPLSQCFLSLSGEITCGLREIGICLSPPIVTHFLEFTSKSPAPKNALGPFPHCRANPFAKYFYHDGAPLVPQRDASMEARMACCTLAPRLAIEMHNGQWICRFQTPPHGPYICTYTSPMPSVNVAERS